jgi:hypothetical protein
MLHMCGHTMTTLPELLKARQTGYQGRLLKRYFVNTYLRTPYRLDDDRPLKDVKPFLGVSISPQSRISVLLRRGAELMTPARLAKTNATIG